MTLPPCLRSCAPFARIALQCGTALEIRRDVHVKRRIQDYRAQREGRAHAVRAALQAAVNQEIGPHLTSERAQGVGWPF